MVVLTSCLALMGAACGGDDTGPSDVVANAPDNLTGPILDVKSESLQEVTGFTLKDGDTTYEIFIADDVDYGFDLGHLREHLRTGDPVTVSVDVRDDKLYALSIEDV